MSDSLTPFSKRAEILADLWMNYRDDEEFQDFIEYNDLGLPLSYAITANLVSLTSAGESLVNETWDLFLAGLEIEDSVFDTLDDILGF